MTDFFPKGISLYYVYGTDPMLNEFDKYIQEKNYTEIINRADSTDDYVKKKIIQQIIVQGDFEGFKLVSERFGYTDYLFDDCLFLRTAIYCKDEESACQFVQYFLECGCDVQVMDNVCLKLAAQHPENFKLKSLLLNNGADIHAENDYVFRLSCYYGRNWNNIKFWLENGANIHADNEYALRVSVYNYSYDNLCYLVDSGANINVCDDYLLRNCFRYDPDGKTIKKLLEHGVNMNVITIDDIRTCIHNQNLTVLKILSEHGFDFTKIAKWQGSKYKCIIDFFIEQDLDLYSIAMLILP